MAEFTAEVAAADTERRQWWLEKEDTIKECLLGEMQLVENEEGAKSGGATAVAIEFGDRERLQSSRFKLKKNLVKKKIYF